MKVNKVIFISFQISHYGGIIENVEEKIKALQRLDIETDVWMFEQAKKTKASFETKVKKIKSKYYEANSTSPGCDNFGYYLGEGSGYYTNSFRGWVLPPENSFCHKEIGFLERFRKRIAEQPKGTVIIWSFLPTKRKEWQGIGDWTEIFNNPSVFQIYSCHDAYHHSRNGHFMYITKYMKFAIAVHAQAYTSMSNFDIPRKKMLRGVDLSDMGENDYDFDDRGVDYYSGHMFKTSKKIEEFLRTIRYLNANKDLEIVISGTGMEYSDMTSPDLSKVPAGYRMNRRNDPDWDGEDNKIRLWDETVKKGYAEYFGLISIEDVQNIQKNTKFFVDFSRITDYNKTSPIILNGSMIEAMKNGCVPIFVYNDLRDPKQLYDVDASEQIKGLYLQNKATPKQKAIQMKMFAKQMTQEKYQEIIENNREFLRNNFEINLLVANLIYEIESGEWKERYPVGKVTDEVIKNAEEIQNFFKQ